jgi:hypothetical protein
MGALFILTVPVVLSQDTQQLPSESATNTSPVVKGNDGQANAVNSSLD